MFNNINSRWVLIGTIILFALYLLWPTYKYYSLSENELKQLESNAPEEFKVLKNKSINLGLDLQGGMHVVLEVDIPNLVKKLSNNSNIELVNTIEESEKESIINRTDFFVEFNNNIIEKSISLKKSYSRLISSTGNTDVMGELKNQVSNSIASVLEIIRNRVDEFGVSEPNIQKSGNNRIIVELAGVKDTDRARNLIQSTALLEFILVKDFKDQQSLFTAIDDLMISENIDLNKNKSEINILSEPDSLDALDKLFNDNINDESILSDFNTTPNEILKERPFSGYIKPFPDGIGVFSSEYSIVKEIIELDVVKNIIPKDGKFLWGSKEKTAQLEDESFISYRNLYFVNNTPELTGGVVKEAIATFGSTGTDASGQAVVNLTMNGIGTKKWSTTTGANIGRNVAIVLDGKVFLSPVIRDKIPSGSTQISGIENVDKAKDIANVLRAGALPTPVNIIEERTVGPSLGRDSISSGTKAMFLGLMIVIIFMIFYYNGSGLLATLALILNLIIVLGVLAGLKATLTLPGIAGLILTIGMAVDANVIIFERIREELNQGKTVRAAIDSAYKKAFTTILDANLTTLIAAFVLLAVGSGPIKGFSITLSIGICSSMFTAIFITRTFYLFIMNNKTIKKLSI